MKKKYPCLEARKVRGTIIQEVYTYLETDKETFLKHYKEMRKRGFKNDRLTDTKENEFLFVTYQKNALSKKEHA